MHFVWEVEIEIFQSFTVYNKQICLGIKYVQTKNHSSLVCLFAGNMYTVYGIGPQKTVSPCASIICGVVWTERKKTAGH
jgi:hypothetical protein